MPLINAKQAVEVTIKYITELTLRPQSDFSLEEVELSSDKIYWYVTLGYLKNVFSGAKEYKEFKVDANTGDVLSMKIRKV